jgi:hypothetical protein
MALKLNGANIPTIMKEGRKVDKPHIHSHQNVSPVGKQLTYDVQPHSILQNVVFMTLFYDLNECSTSHM